MVTEERYGFFAKIKRRIASILGRSKLRILLRMFSYNFSMLFNFKRFRTIDEDDIYDYKNNILPKRMFRHSPYYGNIMYGADYTFNHFVKKKIRYKGYVEHGLYLGEAAEEADVYRKYFKSVITFSNFRLDIIKKTNPTIKALPVGPYIHYAIPKNDEFILKEKEKNGKTLLVFPQHSTDNISVEFDVKEIIKKIEWLKEKFSYQTVIVCLYFRDIIMGRDKDYLQMSYRVVTSGYKEDPLFLSRQKTFLLLSDGVLTNDIGTYVGYAIFYKKPVCLFRQNKSFIDLTGLEKTYDKSINEIMDGDRNFFLESLFYKDDMIISKEQYDACSYFWGFDCIKDEEQLYNLLKGRNIK